MGSREDTSEPETSRVAETPERGAPERVAFVPTAPETEEVVETPKAAAAEKDAVADRTPARQEPVEQPNNAGAETPPPAPDGEQDREEPVVEAPAIETPDRNPPIVEAPAIPAVERPAEQDPVQETPVMADVPERTPEPVEQEAPARAEPPLEAPVQDAGVQGPGADGATGVQVDGALQVVSGRVTTLVPEGDNIASVQVLQGPQEGTLTVNPDNTLALVLTDTSYTGTLNLSYEVTFANGSTQTVAPKITAVEGPVEGGWGQGNFYMLETDANDNLIVEHGDNHRDVYVSGDDTALSLQEIADIEGLSVDKITGRWLSNHPEYGSSPETALADDAGSRLWKTLSQDSYKEPASHWLHLEKGYDYDMGGLLHKGMYGESELHPLHITAYGTGDKPVITSDFGITGEGVTNVVVSDITFTKGGFLNPGRNLIMENVTSTGDAEFAILQSDGFTLRNSEIYDIHHEAPMDPNAWNESKDRVSGIYVGRGTSGVLMENNLFDRNGWEEGYYSGTDPNSPQAPSIYNHNVYIASSVSDLTFRDSISMRGASFGAQFRGGAVVENNVFLDNNAAVFVGGGKNNDDELKGNYSIYSENIVTSAAHRDYGVLKGQVAGGMASYAPMTTLVDNIVTHMADPNNPEEQAEKGLSNFALRAEEDAYYDDTIVHNWGGSKEGGDKWDANTEGLDPNVLDATTIQIFAAQLLGDPDATIDDLAMYLRDSAEDEVFNGVSDAELISDFFRAGFGLDIEDRVIAETLRFVPDDMGDGMRWDNTMNWSTDDLPGTATGDSVDLAGNTVIYGGTNTIKDLDLGDGGELRIGYGRLNVTGEITSEGAGGQIKISEAGQLWTDGYSDNAALEIDVTGGRFANTGAMDGRVDLEVSGGQALLATDNARYDVGDGSRLDIIGDDAKVGFEGKDGGTAVLRFDEGGVLRFEAKDGGIGSIEEFRSGANGDEANDVASGAHFGEATLELDLAGIDSKAGNYTLLSLDEMIGAFSEIDVQGLSNTRDATLVFDYGKDEVVLQMSNAGAGSGNFKYEVLGDQTDAMSSDDLWAALTAGQPVLSDEVVPDTVSVDDQQIYDFL
ncbi:right-handed parallel beta-helix repeat-containing protein [Tropicimonas sp. S265A]|uniref:right-handed parallel beta-helix repeat-containing protein n=1 Tax=Tropicimonas sp. S265A TaxID=3415134 RepID=UPI003C7E3152